MPAKWSAKPVLVSAPVLLAAESGDGVVDEVSKYNDGLPFLLTEIVRKEPGFRMAMAAALLGDRSTAALITVPPTGSG